MADKETEFQEKHESLTRRLGRYPTRAEISGAMGWNLCSSHAYSMAKRLGLELTPLRRGREKAEVIVRRQETQSPSPAKAAQESDFIRRPIPNMARVYELRGSGEARLCPAQLQRAGEEYGIHDRIMLTCPVCGAQALIAPRMHPFYLRNLSGEVIFVDSRACTGQVVT